MLIFPTVYQFLVMLILLTMSVFFFQRFKICHPFNIDIPASIYPFSQITILTNHLKSKTWRNNFLHCLQFCLHFYTLQMHTEPHDEQPDSTIPFLLSVCLREHTTCIQHNSFTQLSWRLTTYKMFLKSFQNTVEKDGPCSFLCVF